MNGLLERMSRRTGRLVKLVLLCLTLMSGLVLEGAVPAWASGTAQLTYTFGGTHQAELTKKKSNKKSKSKKKKTDKKANNKSDNKSDSKADPQSGDPYGYLPDHSTDDRAHDSDAGHSEHDSKAGHYEEDHPSPGSSSSDLTGNALEIDEDGEYTSKDEVAAYIFMFDCLPSNFITKNEAKELGWVSSEGNLWKVAPGKSIGGDRFGNYEGTLPEKKGRRYTECDIDTDGSYRGSKRIVFSNDGLVFYTEDHYETFEQLWPEDFGL
ncbi:MAG: ribonuclease domain-containing protein [Lachnospiraceae bacterium]|nr:ribonuclease domain-containing protein [Lachnospiraceae bacterium]